MHGLSTTISTLDAPSLFLPYVHALALKHYDYGVTPKYYEPAAVALLDTLRTGLGDGFNDEVRNAWTATCEFLFGEMNNATSKRTTDKSVGH